jgi:hypothetical protein
MEWNLLLSTLSLPGLFLGAYLVNKIGRKWLLVGGFACYLVLGLVIVRLPSPPPCFFPSLWSV